MGVAAWPGSLPQNQFYGLRDRRSDATLRRTNDIGPADVRQRFSSASRFMGVPIKLTNAQRSTFDTFFITTLREGSLAWDWTDPVDDASVEFRFLPPPPEWEMRAGYWVATMNLELLP